MPIGISGKRSVWCSSTYAMVIDVLPLLIFSRERKINFSVSESRDAVASSMRSICGDFNIDLAIAI
jgi:hypothetical protein